MPIREHFDGQRTARHKRRYLTVDHRADQLDFNAWEGYGTLNIFGMRQRDKMYRKDDENFEWEIILLAKPPNSHRPLWNHFQYKFQSRGLDFHYQAADDSPNVFQPPNVIGSYAVYRSDRRRGNFHGLEESHQYGTGKAFHIYRPFAVDAAGKRVWCDLHIQKDNDGSGLISVIVPRRFLEQAAYPIVIDPTFGRTTAGASELVYSGSTGKEVIVGWKTGTVTGAGTITDANIYGRVNGTVDGGQNGMIGAYIHDAVLADTDLLAASETVINFDSGTSQWFTASASGALVASTTYDIAIVGEDTASASRTRINYDNTTWGDIKRSTINFADGFDLDLTGYTDSARNVSAYFDYTTGGGSPDVLFINNNTGKY